MRYQERNPWKGFNDFEPSARFERASGEPADDPRPHRGGHGPRGRGPDRGDQPGRGERGGRRGGPGGPFGRGRAQRGDVRAAILLVIADQPMHGYEIMRAISDRTEGIWRPSPGAIYPTIAQLEDEGLVTVTEEGGRKMVSVTDAGRAASTERDAQRGDPFAEFTTGTSGPDLRGPMHELAGAARQIGMTGSQSQREAAVKVLAQARRSLYLILAGDDEDAQSDSAQ